MKVTDKYVFFWKESPFTNFTPCKIKFEWTDSHIGEEIYFTSSEQYFMWRKAIFFNDTETADKIVKAKSPEEARLLGRQVKNYNDKIWDKVRFNHMTTAVMDKFIQNKDLRDKLCDPKYDGKKFVEAAYYDNIWGIGFNEHDALDHDESMWGQNLLGHILDNVRDWCKQNMDK